jgi:hypothetical protein
MFICGVVVRKFVTWRKKSRISFDIVAGVRSLSNLDENERLLEYDVVPTGKYLLVLQWRFKPPSSEWQVPPETWYLFPFGHAIISSVQGC